MDIKAYKMDGLGNDFVIIDGRNKSIELSKEQIIKICDRNFASLAVVVVFPEPCKPTNIIGTGGTAFKFISELLSPNKWTNSS